MHGDSHTYALVTACGGTVENFAFNIVGDQLQTRGRLDFEAQSSYSICVRTTDSYGASFDKALTVTVNNVNEAPTAIGLSNNVAENSQRRRYWTLSAIDVDAGSSFVFGLPAELDNTRSPSAARRWRPPWRSTTKPRTPTTSRSRSQDNGTPPLSYSQVFTVVVLDVNEAPVANHDPGRAAAGRPERLDHHHRRAGQRHG